MSICYTCRYCRTALGTIDRGDVNEYQLGFHFLTPEERRDIINYDENGDVLVKVVCEYCRQALETNPELLLVASPLQ